MVQVFFATAHEECGDFRSRFFLEKTTFGDLAFLLIFRLRQFRFEVLDLPPVMAAMRGMGMGGPRPLSESLLGISYYNSAAMHNLSAATVMDYFANPANPFYDRTCNNEIIKMQRLSPEHLVNMTGIEFVVLHSQEPILYIIRKQSRMSPTHATPLSDFYIIAGQVYQAPDLATVINSRVLNVIHHLESALEESLSYSRFHPSRGYWWEFSKQDPSAKKAVAKKVEEGSSVFQRQRVDMLLADWCQQFPAKPPPRPPLAPAAASAPAVPRNPGVVAGPRPVAPQNGIHNPGPAAAGVKSEEQSQQPRTDGAHANHNNVDGDSRTARPPPEKKRRME